MKTVENIVGLALQMTWTEANQFQPGQTKPDITASHTHSIYPRLEFISASITALDLLRDKFWNA